MDRDTAIQVIVQGIDAAIQKGVFNLSDVEKLIMAVQTIKKPQVVAQVPQETSKSEFED